MPAHSQLRTNRDLYQFIAGLRARSACRTRSLEDYLKALWQLGAAQEAHKTLPLPAFAALLEAALEAPPPPFDPAWARNHGSADRKAGGHARWQRTILDQIVDLHEMAEAGTLADDQRYFGVDAPRGARWYNFDPGTYLECATAGSVGGWRAGDDTGRALVPGEVAVLDEDGNLTAVDPAELDEPTVAIAAVPWDAFADFLVCGRCYE